MKVLTPGYYARHDTKTPLRFAMISIAVNLALNLMLIPALGSSLRARRPPLQPHLRQRVNVWMLYHTLTRRGHFESDAQLRRRVPRLAIASLIMGAALFWLAPAVDPYLTGSILRRGGGLIVLVGGGAAVYAIACFLTGAFVLNDVKLLIKADAKGMNIGSNVRVVSGIQPTGGLHIGNLLGAILRWVRMQDEAECLYFLADLHSLSDHINPEERRSALREMAAALLASGIDPNSSILFAQSACSCSSRSSCWILSGTARTGWLNRMTQWKDKAGKNREGASVALFDYPVLQAADILLYRATHVPVGEDQKQHIELTRDIALKFNTDFSADVFVVPDPFIGGGTAARVMSLRDGRSKMSKSDLSDMSRIHLTDSDELIAQKIRKAKTDPEPLPDDRCQRSNSGRRRRTSLVSTRP